MALTGVQGAFGEASISQTASSASAVIAANDPIMVSVARLAGDTGGAEGTDAVFEVELAGGDATTDTMVDWYITALGEGMMGVASTNDFVAVSGTVSVPQGNVSERVSVEIVDDADLEPPESYSFALRNLRGGGEGDVVFEAQSTTGVIPGSDRIALTVAVLDPASGTTREEDEDRVTFRVTYGEGTSATAPTEEVTVRYGFAGTAEGGTGGEGDYDYPVGYAAASGTVTIGTGVAYADVTLRVNDDMLDEADETIILELREVVVGSGVAEIEMRADSTRSAATVTILDDDKLTLAVTVVNERESESGGQLGFTVSLLNDGNAPTRPRTTEVRVAYTLTGDATGGSAVPGTGIDYAYPTGYNAAMSSGVVVLSAGRNSEEVLVTLNDDTVSELDETITFGLVRILAGGDVAQLGATTQTDIVIIENDALQAGIAIIGGAAVTETDTTLVFEVTLTPDSLEREGDVVMPYAISGDVGSGDYTDLGSGSITIGMNDSTAHIMVRLMDDEDFESDETLTVTLQSATGAYINNLPQSDSVTIRNNDAESVGVVVSAGVYLQGAYDVSRGDIMRTNLIGVLPRQQPYGVAPSFVMTHKS